MAPPAPAVTASSSLDLDLGLDLGLDLDAPLTPAPPTPAPPAAAPPAARPPVTPAAPAAPAFSGSLLDLDDHGDGGGQAEQTPDLWASPSTASTAATITPPTTATPVRRPLGPRIPDSGRGVLTPEAPTVALSPLESGIGTLTVEAAISAEVGDVQLGCAYAFASGRTSFLNPDSGRRSAPADAKLPILVGGRGRFPRISVDLRQVRELERLVFIVHSASQTPLSWGGTLVATTHAGHRVQVPLDHAENDVAVAAMSVYQVRGELVLRAELDTAASVREAAVAFGFDQITWLDDRTPIT